MSEVVATYECRIDKKTGGKVWVLVEDEDVQITNLRLLSDVYEIGTKVCILEGKP